MVAAIVPDRLEKRARVLLACAKWMQEERHARLAENRPALREAEIDKRTRELFDTNWGSAYNSLKILECLGEEYIEKAIQEGIAFSALYAFTHEEDPRLAFDIVVESIHDGTIAGRPSHDKIYDYLQKLPKPLRRKEEPIEQVIASIPEETREEEVTEQPFQAEQPFQKDEAPSAPSELSALDALLSPYQTRFKPYVKPKDGLMLMRTPAHLPISRGRRAVVDSKNVLDEESLMHMKIYIVAQASNGKVHVSRQFSWLTMDHFMREHKERRSEEQEAYIAERCKEMRRSLEAVLKRKNLYLVMAEEILSSSREYIVKFLHEQNYIVGKYKEIL